MASEIADLQARREAMLGKGSNSDDKTERVWKFFTGADKARAIKAAPAKLIIGSGGEEREVTIRPLNPKQFVEAYGLIKDILVPLIGVFEPNADGTPKQIGLVHLMNALGDNVARIPELVEVILRRGNSVSLDWIQEHLDLSLDIQQIIPVFLEQNDILKLLGNEKASVPNSDTAAASTVSDQETTTAE